MKKDFELFEEIRKQVESLNNGFYCIIIKDTEYSLMDNTNHIVYSIYDIVRFIKKMNELFQLKNEIIEDMYKSSLKEIEQIFFNKIDEYNGKKDFSDKIVIYKRRTLFDCVAIHIFFSKANWHYNLIEID